MIRWYKSIVKDSLFPLVVLELESCMWRSATSAAPVRPEVLGLYRAMLPGRRVAFFRYVRNHPVIGYTYYATLVEGILRSDRT